MSEPLNVLSIATYLEKLASSDPAPGGGAVVGLLGAQACALLAMALRVTGDDAKGLQSGQYNSLLKHLDDKRALFMQLATDDAQAFSAVMNAYKLPKGDDGAKKARTDALQAAFKEATRVPLRTMAELSALFDVAEAVTATAKAAVASDAGVALQLLAAGLQSSRYNLWINLKYISDDDFKNDIKKSAHRHLTGVKERRRTLHQRVKTLIRS